MPLREESNWIERFEEDEEVEPFRKYYLIFEGAVTELVYFRGLANNSKEIGISNEIEIIILNKVGDIKHHSSPEQILGFLMAKKSEIEKQGEYEPDIDKFVIVFDRDSFKENPDEYDELIGRVEKDIVIAVTSPCFELWLLLHKRDVIDEFIKPNYDEILANPKISNNHTVMSRLFSEQYGLNPKKKMNFCVFKNDIDIAIENEKLLEQDYKKLGKAIGSNIGVLIEELKEDPRKWIE